MEHQLNAPRFDAQSRNLQLTPATADLHASGAAEPEHRAGPRAVPVACITRSRQVGRRARQGSDLGGFCALPHERGVLQGQQVESRRIRVEPGFQEPAVCLEFGMLLLQFGESVRGVKVCRPLGFRLSDAVLEGGP